MSNYRRKKEISTPLKKILCNLNCSQFFPNYAPDVKNWKQKLAGHNGIDKPLEFYPKDTKLIMAGLKKMQSEILLFKLEFEK